MYAFNYFFGEFVYSFKTPDEKIAHMNDTEKGMYYRAVVEWRNSDAYPIEHFGELTDVYYELAAKSQTDELMAAYRLVMLREKNRDIRLQTKIAEYLANKAFQKTNHNLK